MAYLQSASTMTVPGPACPGVTRPGWPMRPVRPRSATSAGLGQRRVPPWDGSARQNVEREGQHLRDPMAVDVGIRHLPVRRLAVVRHEVLEAHRDRVRGRVPPGDRTWLRPVDVELAHCRCPGTTPVPPGQLPDNGRSAHAHVDVLRALNHPGPADRFRLHPYRDGSRARRDRAGVRARPAAGRQPTRKHRGREDAQDPGCAGQLKIHPRVPLRTRHRGAPRKSQTAGARLPGAAR